VELMIRDPVWPPEPDPRGWTLAEVSRVLEAATARLEALSAQEAARPPAAQEDPEALPIPPEERLRRCRPRVVALRDNVR
jgi:hypothetical protein